MSRRAGGDPDLSGVGSARLGPTLTLMSGRCAPDEGRSGGSNLERVTVHSQVDRAALRLHRVDGADLEIDGSLECHRLRPHLLAQRILPAPPGQFLEHGVSDYQRYDGNYDRDIEGCRLRATLSSNRPSP